MYTTYIFDSIFCRTNFRCCINMDCVISTEARNERSGEILLLVTTRFLDYKICQDKFFRSK